MMSSVLRTRCALQFTIKAKFDRRYASNQSNETKQTCLYGFHKDKGARMEPFAGFMMPIVYKGQTIKSEHMQTRNAASVFDVSHMMQTVLRGKDRVRFLESLTVADIEGMTLNKCSLSVFTNDAGGIIDDCIIGKFFNHIQVVSNAANADLVWEYMNEALNQNSKLDVGLERLNNQGLVALQGPKAAKVLQKLTNMRLDDLKFMNTTETELHQIGKCTITRCGYTGEDGFEISIQPESCGRLMTRLCEDESVRPAGLGARDTLRLEAGLCLHGQDIDEKITPTEAALSWIVHKRRRESGDFSGASQILEQLRNGSKIIRVGLIAWDQGGPPAREGSEVLGRASTPLGKVTSGNFAPTLNRNIAMAYLPTDVSRQHGHTVFCTVRGKELKYQITKMPFVRTNYYV